MVVCIIETEQIVANVTGTASSGLRGWTMLLLQRKNGLARNREAEIQCYSNIGCFLCPMHIEKIDTDILDEAKDLVREYCTIDDSELPGG